ncbi:hypothetical protein H8D36_07320 [archaeon]|nr:hypothetical protein [archaeon]
MVACDFCDGGCGCSDKIPTKFYFCPKCKSANVKYVFGFGNLFGVVPKMKCSKCGFSAPVFPQLVKLSKKQEKNMNSEFKSSKDDSVEFKKTKIGRKK